MARKKGNVEFRYYEIPHGEPVLALYGDAWIRTYGYDEKDQPILDLHFHNLLEVGLCIYGDGEIILEETAFPYQAGTLTVIPKIIRIRRMRQIISQTNGSICFWTLISFLQNFIRITDGFQNDWLTVSENAPAVRRCRSIRLWHYWYARF